jgi:hypothetical protein
MSLPDPRKSPSGRLVPFTATSDDVVNLSGVPGTKVTAALDTLFARSVQYLDLLDGPIALWNFNNTLAAVLGPTLTLGAGTFGFTDVYPGVAGLWLNSTARLDAPATPNLRLLGAMSCELLVQMQTAPPNIWMCGCGGTSGSALAADNVSWSVGLPSATFPQPMRAAWEQGAGVGVTFDSSTVAGSFGYPFIHQIESIGMSRSAGGIVQFFMGGKPFGPPSGVLTMPTGGGSGIFTVGAQLGLTSVAQPMYLSIAVYDRERSAAEFLASYNRSVGLGLGFVS